MSGGDLTPRTDLMSGADLTPRTVVVVPAYNESEALPGVLAELDAEVPDLDVVVVDDGSADGTDRVARSAGVVCVRLPFNMGLGGALRTGFRYAVDRGYDRVVQVDGDGQHRAAHVQRLLDTMDEGADLVIGNRFAGGDYRVGRTRSLAMALLRLEVRALCSRRYRDPSSGFRGIAEPLLSVFAAEYPVEFMESVESLVAATRAGYRVAEVSVEMDRRVSGVPSTRGVHLAYHYARLAVSLVSRPHRFPARETVADS